MGKIHLDFLAKKYPDIEWEGKTYEYLMAHIIANNASNVSKKCLKITQESFSKVLEKVEGKKRFVLPSVQEVLPKKSIFIRKGAEKGKLLTDTLRDRLTTELRDALNEYEQGGAPSMVQRRGIAAGRISPKLVRKFKEGIKKVFINYTKKDPHFGVPSNVKAIAVTEMRSAINDVKHKYVTRMENENPDYEIMKRWIHNSALVKVGREGHIKIAQSKPIPANSYFKIPLFTKINGRMKPTEKYINALHPHDPALPPEQIINCNCDSEYIIRKKENITG